MKDILILSTGGTFNKIYNRIEGSLEIDKKFTAVKRFQKHWLSNYKYDAIINKDSLEFTHEDRQELIAYLKQTSCAHVVIIHGTDTMHLSALAIAKEMPNKTIVLTGSMVPFSIKSIEATANLASAIGFCYGVDKSGVYIAMNGSIAPFNKISKDRKVGCFKML